MQHDDSSKWETATCNIHRPRYFLYAVIFENNRLYTTKVYAIKNDCNLSRMNDKKETK